MPPLNKSVQSAEPNLNGRTNLWKSFIFFSVTGNWYFPGVERTIPELRLKRLEMSFSVSENTQKLIFFLE